jgi:hypothetical protein
LGEEVDDDDGVEVDTVVIEDCFGEETGIVDR